MATNMKSLNGYGFDAAALGGYSLSEIMLKLYPVGAVYTSTVDTSPASLFGGTWEQLQDRFLLAAGSTYSAGSMGGEATHTLTVYEMPYHRHYVHGNLDSAGGNQYSTPDYINSPSETAENYNWGTYTSYEGGNNPHNNMPPYLAVYMWKRVS